MEKIISVQNLRKTYKKSGRSDYETAVGNVCFELMPGNIMGLLGTNGGGKTTTLKMITNLIVTGIILVYGIGRRANNMIM